MITKKTLLKAGALYIICIFICPLCYAQLNEDIRIDQIGYYPDAAKKAVVTATNTQIDKFSLRNMNGKTVYTNKLIPSAKAAFSGQHIFIADFSGFNVSGKYQLYVPGLGYSYPFDIKKAIHAKVAAGTIKAYYFFRASTPLDEKYAGQWHRAEGHPDTTVLIHPSAQSDKRPAGTIISAPRGWYDAGDYNKYIVNSGITTATLLSLYEDFPEYMKTVKLDIPESNNQLPDVLDEVLWNLRWMLTMQDPADGGVYHKLTNANFESMIMPDKAVFQRYVVQKGTAATLDFAAVMAQASRILAKFPKQLPGLADSCIKASEKAWQWAKQNPGVVYDQNELNKQFKPEVTTGAYGDRNFSDEFIWAASELYTTTGNEKYLSDVVFNADDRLQVPSWSQVKLLGYYTLAKNSNAKSAEERIKLSAIRKGLISFADKLISGADSTAYQSVMTKSKANFNWGSNSNAANQGVLLIKAYQLTNNRKYLDYALSNLEYILGVNGTGYSYVTGFGSKTPMHPHHRPSVADGIKAPIPGMLVGGPNPGMQDSIKVPSVVPDEAYIDDDRAYAVNEIAINWNAPMAYLTNAIEALQKQLAVN
ncbi:glycoside hydrolase family 9 protein [Mucilaginibacter segetis]|uniref:Endoglucanase n=1 Tax=Mucilaginibacter segetis TaxID=2793071 RepID=A0A934PXC3_9SPHI|nr:glycoside hydrolase family 9 protein [Mucilaginibacter segetis]MBK0381105.1 glycoside hydrolase family 9 protein [Mucilaginibacter segetis]